VQSVKRAYCEYLSTDEGAEVYRAFQRIVYAQKDSFAEKLDNDILRHFAFPKREALRVCDIGGGDGRRIVRILGFLHRRFAKRFHLDFVEQSRPYLNIFDTAPIKNFCEVTKIHNFFENVALPRNSYDLVFLIHSIFAFTAGAVLRKVLSLRKADGKIIVVSNAPGSVFGGLKMLTDDDFRDKRYEIDDLERELCKLGVRYTRRTTITEWAIEKRNWKRDVEVVLNWISFGRYGTFPSRKREEIQEYLQRRGKSNGGRTFFREEELVLVIPAIW
jgi:hypothetical protein